MNGSSAMILLASLLACLPAAAQTSQAREADASMIELLEFLGEWETEDGTWIDPESLDEQAEPPAENNDE